MDIHNVDECTATGDLTAVGDGADFRLEGFNGCVKQRVDVTFASKSMTSIAENSSVAVTHCFGSQPTCKCCQVWLDSGEELPESNESNNDANDNHALETGVVGRSVRIQGAISNIRDIPVTISSSVIAPPGWTVNLINEPLSTGADGVETIELEYLIPAGLEAAGQQIEVISQMTGSETFTQNNVFNFNKFFVPGLSPGLIGLTVCLLAGGGWWGVHRIRRKG